jgi:hypothetical protein
MIDTRMVLLCQEADSFMNLEKDLFAHYSLFERSNRQYDKLQTLATLSTTRFVHSAEPGCPDGLPKQN